VFSSTSNTKPIRQNLLGWGYLAIEYEGMNYCWSPVRIVPLSSGELWRSFLLEGGEPLLAVGRMFKRLAHGFLEFVRNR
jgi:hypothetical protein